MFKSDFVVDVNPESNHRPIILKYVSGNELPQRANDNEQCEN